MAKTKAKKKNLSDLKNDKSKKQKDSLNPFEVHVNRQKFHVLGRKLKQDRGLPGLARAKSIKKRKETLLQEYKYKDKANKFIDRRIGERNSAMTKEDKILARFTAERLKAHKRKAMFNLGEDEVLTHKGRSIAEIETFEGPSSDEDERETSRGKLDAIAIELQSNDRSANQQILDVTNDLNEERLIKSLSRGTCIFHSRAIRDIMFLLK